MDGYFVLFLFGLSFYSVHSHDSHQVQGGNDSEPKCGENEEYNGCTNGGCKAKNCSQIGKPVPCVRLDPRFCLRGCLCKEGYLRDENGECLKKNQCREAIQCSHNEEFSPCTNGGCDARHCSQLGRPVPCVKLDPKSCVRGCVCKAEYLRAESGECVLKQQCHKECNKPNEEKRCVADCPPQKTCKNMDILVSCLQPSTENCKDTCVCKEGYFRNAGGNCVTRDYCTRCTGPHEYFACGSECDNVCSTYPAESQNNCSKVNIQCNKKCYCEEGYARDAQGVCVLIKDCPK